MATVLLCALADAPAGAVEPFPFSLNLESDFGSTLINFQAWIPDNVERLRGMVVAFPGSGADTRNITSNASWRRRLQAMGFGIVGFRDVPENLSYWGATSEQGHANIQAVLDTIAGEFAHPEISNAPMIMEGFSKGGQGAEFVAYLVQDRAICYVSDKGFFEPFVSASDFHVPGLLIGGQFDELQPPEDLYPVFEAVRQVDSNLALAVDWTKGHVETEVDLRLAYMAQALRVRYPEGQLPSLTPGNPLPLVPTSNFTDVWLGESNPLASPGFTRYFAVGQPKIAPIAEYVVSEDKVTSWLPTEAMAKVYQSHNDSTLFNRQFSLTASNPPTKKHILLEARPFGISPTKIEIFHDEELVGVLGPGETAFRYFPRARGLHTFLAVVEYPSDGAAKYTSDYAVGVAQEGVPEPAAVALLAGGLLTALQLRHGGNLRKVCRQ